MPNPKIFIKTRERVVTHTNTDVCRMRFYNLDVCDTFTYLICVAGDAEDAIYSAPCFSQWYVP